MSGGDVFAVMALTMFSANSNDCEHFGIGTCCSGCGLEWEDLAKAGCGALGDWCCWSVV